MPSELVGGAAAYFTRGSGIELSNMKGFCGYNKYTQYMLVQALTLPVEMRTIVQPL